MEDEAGGVVELAAERVWDGPAEFDGEIAGGGEVGDLDGGGWGGERDAGAGSEGDAAEDIRVGVGGWVVAAEFDGGGIAGGDGAGPCLAEGHAEGGLGDGHLAEGGGGGGEVGGALEGAGDFCGEREGGEVRGEGFVRSDVGGAGLPCGEERIDFRGDG